MKIVFLSNYFSHHQKQLSDELASRVDYTFISTAQIPQERKTLGWGTEQIPEYVCHYRENTLLAEEKLERADVILVGSAPETLIRACIQRNQLVFRYHERPLKKGLEPLKYPFRWIRWHLRNPSKQPVYLLCASAFTAGDYAKFGLFSKRAFRWGYFPETKRFGSPEMLTDAKQPATILWAGRLLDWKHPDDAVFVAEKLKETGTRFEMNIIGSGPMEGQLRERIVQKDLADCVHLLGSMKPDRVRSYMEQSEIFLFTSDRREGWGAVVNEAMNSGCAVVASDAAGSVPYLIRNGENGMVYHSGDVDGLSEGVMELLEQPILRKQLGIKAYRRITELWNAETAAERLFCLAEGLLEGKVQSPYNDGPCSPAPIIRDDWFIQ